jgi:hypothetical protein
MKESKALPLIIIILSALLLAGSKPGKKELMSRNEILETMTLCNAYFMEKWPDV